MSTIRQSIAEAATLLRGEYAARDAELLLMHALGATRASLLANPQRELTREEEARFSALIAERATGKPIQYITGVQEFYGLEFAVTPDVLIPRPETEHLIEAVLTEISVTLFPRTMRKIEIADVGTGSGVIGVTLASSLPAGRVTALDISPAALEVARRNAETHQVVEQMLFLESDLLGACGRRRFHVIVSNPPYIADSEVLEKQVAEFEPSLALFAGSTGYEIYERLIPQAWKSLHPDGLLAMEIGFGQAARLAELLHGWSDVTFLADLQNIPRVVLARR